MKIEEIKPHPEYPEYGVSIDGDIYRIFCFNRKIKPRKLSPAKSNCGYLRVGLSINGKSLNKCVHSLVAETFIGPRENKMTVNHKDGNKTNNKASNLEYLTYSENLKHAFRIGIFKPAKGEACSVVKYPEKHREYIRQAAKLDKEKVLEIRKLCSSGMFQKEVAKIYGVTPSNISNIVKERTWRDL